MRGGKKQSHQSNQTADDVHKRARDLVATLEFQLQQLEEGGDADLESGATPIGLTENLNLLLQDVSTLERMLEEGGEREILRKRAVLLAADAQALRHSVERFLKNNYAFRKEKNERSLLFGGAASRAESVAVDSFLRERTSLTSSHAMLDEVSAAAENVMGALQGQRTTLKVAHKRVLDIASSLGVSNSLMKIIERRTVGDKVLVYGGSAFISLLLLAVWWWK
jgi:Golgi SNAP receptor complex protein 2